MAVFIVTYDLRKQRNYKSLHDRLTNMGGVHTLKSVYFISLNVTASQLLEDLSRYIDRDDAICVARLAHDVAWKDDNSNYDSALMDIFSGT